MNPVEMICNSSYGKKGWYHIFLYKKEWYNMQSFLYTIDGCTVCQRARVHLKDLKIPYIEINILQERESVKEIKEKVGEIILPVFVMGQKWIIAKEILMLDEGDIDNDNEDLRYKKALGKTKN